MGSLMAGWDSPVSDPKAVYRRSKSLTKQEIEAFWKSKKRKEEEHLRDLSHLSPRGQEENIFGDSTTSETLSTAKEKLLESQTSLEKLIQKNGWWISSDSAFLNEPPVIVSDSNQKYAAQFHVAKLAADDLQTGIRA